MSRPTAVARERGPRARPRGAPDPLATPALDAWRRRGDPALRDGLWAAACWEATAVEADGDQLRAHAKRCLARAEALVESDPAAAIALDRWEGTAR